MESKFFASSLWIWHTDEIRDDEYGEFLCEFEAEDSAICNISCHDDYALFLNGRFVNCSQFADFDHFKSVDTLDISKYLVKGKNTLAVLVWYCGVPTFRFAPCKAGLIFEITDKSGKLLAASGKDTLARESKAYACGRKKIITPQLGPGFLYDATKEDDWLKGNGEGFAPAVAHDTAKYTFIPRPTKKHNILPRHESKVIKVSDDKCYYLIDLGEETVGLFNVEFFSEKENNILFTYGEHIIDGGVRRIIGKRDFSFDYVAAPGENLYTNYTLRLGCRYIELHSEHPVELKYMGVLPQVYPLKPKKVSLDNELDKRIYDFCLNTLRLCMMEHYVDCPWREQGLYALDSRNQMLCGYDAFEDGNFEYAKACLQLMGEDRREDDLLSICFPCISNLTIPSFSLHYFMAIREYTEHSKDLTLAKKYHEKLTKIMNAFMKNMKDGLVLTFSGKYHWNFYDWTKDLQGNLGQESIVCHDLTLNALAILALDSFEAICRLTKDTFPFEGVADKMRILAKEKFFNEEKMLFSMYDIKEGKEIYNVMTNSLAILADIVDADTAKQVCANMLSGEYIDCTLSLKLIKYNAMLKADFDKYRDIVLSEIRKEYSYMLDCGATAAWETIDGAAAFHNAGSLCHGWSAVPLHFYHRFGMVK